MIDAGEFIEAARGQGFSLYSGVPCSYLKPFINYVIDSNELQYVGAANEGDAVAVAAGAELAGRRSVVMFQNSGFGNTVNPLTSLTYTFRIPVLIIVTLRGDPAGSADEPQHELMGQITPELLDLLQIPWAWFPEADEQIEPVLARATQVMDTEQRPFALIMRKGSVAPHALQTKTHGLAAPVVRVGQRPAPEATRADVLRALQAVIPAQDVVIASTGYTGRELYALEDRPGQLYMVGSMGCAVSLGLGIALARPDRRVIVLDGDGALLMRLGALAMLGHECPPNLVHVLLDNGLHESTGGQATLSPAVDFCAVASACGYPAANASANPAEIGRMLAAQQDELLFIYVPMLPGIAADLPRPSVTPQQVAVRLREHIALED